jgi:hypothetical protein
MADEELERFKREIKLHEYAASLGYTPSKDRDDQSRHEMVMRRGEDKISIRKDISDSHYVYYSFRDETDNGSILDFVMRRQERNFGKARQLLRLWAGTIPPVPFDHLKGSAPFDRTFVQNRYAAAKPLVWHDYLEKERFLPRTVLTGKRFQGQIRVDARANPIFPHRDQEGICGYELRNKNFKGFAKLGRKGLWASNDFAGDRILVFSENAIDSISYEAYWKLGNARYRSFAGGLSELQRTLIVEACKTMAAGAEVLCITHPDDAGYQFEQVIREAAGTLPVRVHRPSAVKDWNAFLTIQASCTRASASLPAVLGRSSEEV